MSEKESGNKPEAKIVFDEGQERARDYRVIDYRRLMSMMENGAEPYNDGKGWFVTEFDPDGMGETYPVKENVISQVRTFGNTWIETAGSGRLVLRTRPGSIQI